MSTEEKMNLLKEEIEETASANGLILDLLQIEKLADSYETLKEMFGDDLTIEGLLVTSGYDI